MTVNPVNVDGIDARGLHNVCDADFMTGITAVRIGIGADRFRKLYGPDKLTPDGMVRVSGAKGTP